MMNYAQQIKHPNWQKKRLEVLEYHDFQCENCGAREEELHVHHAFYRKGAMIWQYETKELQCLCHKCHKEAHAIDEQLKQRIALLSPAHKTMLLGYCDSMIGPDVNSDDPDYIRGYTDRVNGIYRVAV